MNKHTFEITSELDLIKIRREVRELISQHYNFSAISRVQILTVISELGRNIINYAKEGRVEVLPYKIEDKNGIMMKFIDNGPGIPNVDKILKEGNPFTKQGLGLGLKGCKELADQFFVLTDPNKGTTIIFVKLEN